MNQSELTTATPSSALPGGGIYVHVPFCSSRCAYCGFFAGGERIADWPRYRRALLAEMGARLQEIPNPVATLYFGGGTPSLMPADEFVKLAEGIRRLSETAGATFAPGEVTIEVNPESVSEEKAAAWAAAGVNRVSMGVQSMQETELEMLGRRHRQGDAERVMRILQERFGNISLDIMYGIPGQTPSSLDDTVRRLLAFRPTHLSAYELMYDPCTLLSYRRERGELAAMDEERVVELYDHLVDSLADAGFLHYEVSNYALPGYESRHNTHYWLGAPYLGLGPGASSYDGARRRRSNPGQLRRYLDAYAPAGTTSRPCERDAFEREVEEECLSNEQLREEYVMTRLRTSAGIRIEDFARRFGEEKTHTLLDRSETFVKDNLMRRHEGSLSVTKAGFLLLDRIILSLAL